MATNPVYKNEIQRFEYASGKPRGYSISTGPLGVGYRVRVWTTDFYGGHERVETSFLLYKNVVKFLEEYRSWWT